MPMDRTPVRSATCPAAWAIHGVPLPALLRRLTSRLVWPLELAILNGQPGKHGVDKLRGKMLDLDRKCTPIGM